MISVHFTETCEKDSPHLIIHVETTSAPVSDDARTAVIHEGLKCKNLSPEQHLVDTGYVDAKLLLESLRDYQIDLVGPTRRNHQWQANQRDALRCRSLSHRLGTPTGDLPRRTQKPQLDSSHRQPHQRGHQNQILAASTVKLVPA